MVDIMMTGDKEETVETVETRAVGKMTGSGYRWVTHCISCLYISMMRHLIQEEHEHQQLHSTQYGDESAEFDPVLLSQ